MTFAYESTTLTIENALYPVDEQYTRHQNRILTHDGTARVYDRDTEQTFIMFDIDHGSANIGSVKDFFKNTVKLALRAFVVTPDAGQDFGGGFGVAVSVRYWDSGLFTSQRVYHRYRNKLILRLESGISWTGDGYADDIDEVVGGFGGN